MSRPELDEQRVGALMRRHLLVIRDHYLDGTPQRTKVFEQLNALAAASAYVLAGTDGEAEHFFREALAHNLSEIKARHG